MDSGATSLDPRTRMLLEAPIFPTLLRLAIPNVFTTLIQASTGLIEAYFIGMLGTDALAGAALVFPGIMLMQMMSAGAMGGGIASAIARALGAGKREDADTLVLHAFIIAATFAFTFTVGVIASGPWLYRALGGKGPVLDAALTYSNVTFAGVILVWMFNTLANIIRGTGNTFVPAIVTSVGAVLLVPLSPCLIFGWGPFPKLGIAGGAASLLIYYAAGATALAYYLFSGRSVLRPKFHGTQLRARLFWEILRVGAAASLVALMTNITIALTTALIAGFGPAAIAGYGVGTRLEYLLIPLTFGFGGALIALVGTNIGAGNRIRAVRSAWIGAAFAFVLTETIGLTAAAFPEGWLRLFDNDPAMIEAGSVYLRTVGPFYGFFGLGMALYFSSQGAGRLMWPLLANACRLVIAVGAGWLALRSTGNMSFVFLALGIAIAAFGLIIATAVARGVWFKDKAGTHT
jgi:putative MATE family efflux protein